MILIFDADLFQLAIAPPSPIQLKERATMIR